MRSEITNKAILISALPIVLESIAQNMLNITDTAFMGRVGEVSLGAAAIGSVFYFIFFMIAFGLGIGTQIIIARRFGEGKISEIGKILQQTQIILLALSVLLFVIIQGSLQSIMGQIVSSTEVRAQVIDYLQIRVFGFFFAFLNTSFRAFYVGIVRTRIITYTTILMTSINVILDYVLIFGHSIFPEMGIQGAALASVIAEFSALIFFVSYTFLRDDFKKYSLKYKIEIDKPLIKKILGISTPLMLQHFVSFACWFAFFILIEKMGELQLAVSNIIRSIYIFMLLPIWGFAATANSFVSQYIGKGMKNEIYSLIPRIILLCLPFILLIVIPMAFFPHQVISIMTDNPEIAENTLPVLYVILGASPLLCAGFIYFSSLTGTGNTLYGFLIESFVLVIYLLVTWYMIKIAELSLPFVWIVEYIYAIVLGLLSFLYIRSGKWDRAKI